MMTFPRYSFLFVAVGLGAVCFSASQSASQTAAQGVPEVSISLDKVYQPMLGFGGTQTYNGDAVLSFPERDRVYRALFADLKIDYLRLRNFHDYEGQQTTFENMLRDYVGGASKYSTPEFRGQKGPVKLLFTSWSPPARLKNNNRINGTSDGTDKGKKDVTLKRGPDGKYVYREFADWWVDSLKTFRRVTGRLPDLVTLQNELDISVTYEGCEFVGTEGQKKDGFELAGYSEALAATHTRIASEFGKDAPGITGPENFTIRLDSGDSQVKRYLDPETAWGKQSLSLLSNISFHIYGNGAEAADPTRYRAALGRLKEVYRDYKAAKPLMETEFLEGVDLVQQASMISDAFVYGDVSAYFVWIIARGVHQPGNALVYYNLSDGSVERRGRFYAVKHFSQFIGEGWHRVEAAVPNDGLRVSAFRKDDGKEAALVLVNPTASPVTLKIPASLAGFGLPKLYRSSETEAGEKFRELGEVKDGTVLLLPRSVATLHWTSSKP